MSEYRTGSQKFIAHDESNACMFGVQTPVGHPQPRTGNTGPAMEMRMAIEQLTYAQLGERFGISPEAARQKAIRSRWKRIRGNDGKTLVEVNWGEVVIARVDPDPDMIFSRKPSKPRAVRDPYEQGTDAQTIQALNGHLNTLREQLEKAELSAAEGRKEVALERERVAELTAQIIKLTEQMLALKNKQGLWAKLFGERK